MADIDPKELVLRNKGLVVIYALAVVPVALWFALVAGGVKGAKGPKAESFQAKVGELRKSERTIKDMLGRINADDPTKKPFTERHIKAFEANHQAYSEQIRQLKQAVAERDRELEKWFDNDLTRNLKPGQDPNPNDYITLYRQQINGLATEYADLVTPEAGGGPRLYDQEPPRNQLRTWQKRFWIQKYLLQALKEGSAESVQAGKRGAKVEQAVRFTDAAKRGEDEGQKVVERLGATITISCRFPDLTRVVARILAQPITFQVLTLRVSKAPFMIDTPELSLRVDGRDTTFNDPFYTAELKNHEQFKGEDHIEDYLPEPPVQVVLELEVLDFAVAPPAEPASGEGQGQDQGAGDSAGSE